MPNKLYYILITLALLVHIDGYSQLAGYAFYKELTIQNSQVAGSGSHINFPVLISEVDSDLIFSGSGGDVQNVNGFDIQFTAADGLTLLDHQIERYISTSGEYQAWVKIPTLSTSANTVIRMYYGNSAILTDQSTDNVWDANFTAVYHLTDDFLDKTSNNNDLANFGTTDNTSGQSAKCRDFALFDYLQAPNDPSIQISGDITLSTWIDPNSIQATTGDNVLMSFGGSTETTVDNQLYFFNIRDDNRLQLFWESGVAADQVAISINPIIIPGSGFTYVSVTRDVSTNEVTFYQDGLPLDFAAASYANDPTGGSTGVLRLGSDNQFAASDFDGSQDEVRISNSVRSADWTLTDFNSVNSPATFYSKGPEIISCDVGFNYAQLQVCANSSSMPLPTISGAPGGTFSSLPVGLSLNSSTGQIDISSSSTGNYSVTYAITGCPADSTVSYDIIAVDNPNFSYLSANYCTNDPDPVALITGTLGGTFSAPAQVSINSSNGQIDVSASTPGGPYSIKYVTPGPLCPDSSTFNITIFDGAEADFNYVTAQHCLDNTIESPVINGTPGGNFTASPAGIVVDFSSGDINLGTSGAGNFDVYYTSPNGCVDTFSVNLIGLDDASFTYPQSSYCQEDMDPSPNLTGTPLGSYSEPTGNLSLNTTTGDIDLSMSTPGASYTITYTTPGPECPVSGTFGITIIAMGDPTFNYSQAAYCQYDTDPAAVVTGTGGGTFVEPTGTLTINSGDGTIDLDAGPTGTYWIVYTTPGLCQKSDSVQVTINIDDDASFNYPQAQYCQTELNPVANITGTTGGTFSSTAGISIIDNLAGEIDLAGSTPNATYTITYTTPGPQCPVSGTFDVTITAIEDASFSYTSNNYCQDELNQTPSVSGVSGGVFSTSSAITLLSPITGEVDIMGSPIGGAYKIYYTSPGPLCPGLDSFDISIGLVEDPSFSYPLTSYCENDINPSPTIDGTSGGTFSANASVSIDVNTGTIDLSNSTPGGPYDITYMTPGPACVRDSIFYITIVAIDDPSFQYTSNFYCELDLDQVPSVSGTAGGSWTANPAGLSIDSNSGTIDIAGSTTNTLFTIQYLSPGQCPDSSTFEITIDNAVAADAGPDQILNAQYSTTLEAVDPTIGTGLWSVSNASQIANNVDPLSGITELPVGITYCYWTVSNGVCPSVTDTMRIQVNDLAIPDVITPNGDGHNDAYVVPGIENRTNSIEILNRWGQTVYSQENYQNDWEGTDLNGELLPDDTYFFILTIEDEPSTSGFIVIKT